MPRLYSRDPPFSKVVALPDRENEIREDRRRDRDDKSNTIPRENLGEPYRMLGTTIPDDFANSLDGL